MQPGINRAVPMGIIGFIAGAALILLIRWLMNMDPVWDPQIGLVGAGFISAFFFLWGVGAFNPEYSAHHAHEPAEGEEEHVDDHAHEAEPEPVKILGFEVWTVFFWTIIMFVSMMALALIPGGPGMTVSADPNATSNAFGMFTVELGGLTFEMSQAIAFLLFVVITMFSLFVVAGIIGWLMSRLVKNVSEAKAMQPQPLANYPLIGSPAAASAGALPAPSAEAAADSHALATHDAAHDARKPSLLGRIPRFVWFLIVTAVLMLFFYYVAIGLILPNPNLPGLNAIFADPKAQLFVLSLVNALLFALIILYPVIVLRAIGSAAGWLARLLRRLPEGLGQR